MPSNPASNILVTGEPGIGKTTVIMRVAERLMPRDPLGFYTREMREKGGRKGFELISLDGRRGVLAHVNLQSRYRMGKYGVDIIGFENFLRELQLDRADRGLVIIDEIGGMECFSEVFLKLVSQLLDSDRPLLATIALKGEGIIAEIKKRADIELIKVTRENRDAIPEKIIALPHLLSRVREGRGHE